MAEVQEWKQVEIDELRRVVGTALSHGISTKEVREAVEEEIRDALSYV